MTPDVLLVSAPAEWTVERVPLVEATVRGLLAPAGSRLVVDLSATRFLASAGLTFLIRLGKRLADAGGGLALATASFITSGGTADASATSYAASARQFPIRRIATRVEVNGDIAQNVSMVNDVFEQQIQAKMIAMWNVVGDKLINGTGVDPEPAGLVTLATENADSFSNAGANLTLAKLDEMIRLLRPWDGDTQRAFVMNRGRYAKFVALCHAAGFDPAIMPDRILGKPLAHYMGVPVLVSDFITDTEALTTTSVYLACLGTREGEPQFGGLVWFYNRDTGPGIRVDGPHRTSGTTDLLFSTLELNIGFASLSTGSVLRMSSVGLS